MPSLNTLEELDVLAPKGAFSTLDAEALVPEVEKIPEKGVYVEIGVDKGKSLWIARQVAKKNVLVVGVDLRNSPEVEDTVFYQGDSVRVSKIFEHKIDVLFIDGDHSYEGCKRDIEAWYPLMKKEAVMLFHDCDESSPGVVQAVAEAYQKYGKDWKIFKRTDKNTSMAKIQL